MRVALIVLLVVGASGAAHAFPELTVRGEVTRCTECHVSPAGGGLLTDYGRDESVDTLSRGGDGRFLFGVELPEWLQLGGDFRVAGLSYQDLGATEGVKWAAFPMQADLRAAVHSGPFSLVATGGLRGSTRRWEDSDASWTSYVLSPEHYVLWRPEVVGVYARAGRFFPIQGLRLPDHTLYVRRYTGTNLYEEPYGIAAGYANDAWEVHASLFVHDPLIDVGRREAGGVLYGERHSETWSVAAWGRVGTGADGRRLLGGASVRRKLPADTVLFAEADVLRDDLGGDGVTQLAALAGANHRIAQGVQLFAWYEQLQEALGYADATRHAVGATLQLYPRAHWEILLSTRWQLVGDDVVGLEMLQLHFYL